MKFMLDTNTCIALVKREPLQVWQRFEALSAGDVGISWVTMTELEFGVAKSQHQEKNQARVDSRRDVGDEQRWRVLAHRGVGYR